VPTGYAGMSLVVLLPFLWRRMVDPALVAFVGGDFSKINIQPAAREKLLARWGARASDKVRQDL
jgi:alkane 1-monooxygenase